MFLKVKGFGEMFGAGTEKETTMVKKLAYSVPVTTGQHSENLLKPPLMEEPWPTRKLDWYFYTVWVNNLIFIYFNLITINM